MSNPCTPRRLRRLPQVSLPPGDLLRRLRYAGELLATSRQTAHLTIDQVGCLIGLSTTRVGAIEKPAVPPAGTEPQVPSYHKLLLYCQVLGIDYCDLWPPNPESPYAQLRLHLARFHPLSVPRLVALFDLFAQRECDNLPLLCSL